MKNNVPSSISFLIYIHPILYKILFICLIGFCIYSGAYISAVGFSVVYFFRYFMIEREKIPHYIGAGIGFIGLVLHTSVWWPVLLGLLVVLGLKIKKNEDYIFWFEIIAGLPYIYYLI